METAAKEKRLRLDLLVRENDRTIRKQPHCHLHLRTNQLDPLLGLIFKPSESQRGARWSLNWRTIMEGSLVIRAAHFFA
jgi:hypothetical protein